MKTPPDFRLTTTTLESTLAVTARDTIEVGAGSRFTRSSSEETNSGPWRWILSSRDRAASRDRFSVRSATTQTTDKTSTSRLRQITAPPFCVSHFPWRARAASFLNERAI